MEWDLQRQDCFAVAETLFLLTKRSEVLCLVTEETPDTICSCCNEGVVCSNATWKASPW